MDAAQTDGSLYRWPFEPFHSKLSALRRVEFHRGTVTEGRPYKSSGTKRTRRDLFLDRIPALDYD